MSRLVATLGISVLCGLAACGAARQVEGAATAAQATACARCHGGQLAASSGTDPLIHAAPPRTVSGATGGPAVGAHQLHLAGHLSDGHAFAAVACQSCHLLPTGTSHPPQAQGRVTFSGQALSAWPGAAPPQPTWNGTSCSATYCHGAFRSGNAANAPAWAQPRPSSCGTCHGDPATGDPRPAALHPALAAGATCGACHPESVGADGKLLAGGRHLDGQIQVADRHPASWMDTASPNFHALSANRGLADCAACHGADLAGGYTGVSCASCHDASLPPGVASWKVSCTMCHGGTRNTTGAPPRSTWGTGDEPVRVGAHTSHLAAGLTCATCHVAPAEAQSPGHIDPSPAEVAFSGLAVARGAAPSWTRASARCSATYCHGALLTGGTVPAPDWTRVGQGQGACGACHGLPPGSAPSPGHPVYVYAAPCIGCHPGSTGVGAGGANTLLPGGQHLDGAEQHTFAGHPAGWAVPGTGGAPGGLHSNQACMGCGVSPGQLSMTDYYDQCTTCHGQGGDFHPSGGSSRVSCGTCHPAFFDATGATSCSFCH